MYFAGGKLPKALSLPVVSPVALLKSPVLELIPLVGPKILKAVTQLMLLWRLVSLPWFAFTMLPLCISKPFKINKWF